MKRIILATLLLATMIYTYGSECNGHTERAKAILTKIMNADTDSIYDTMSAEMKQGIQRQQLKSMWAILTMQVGEYKSDSEWNCTEQDGLTIVTARLSFRTMDLEYTVSFDPAGNMAGLFFTPAPPKETEEKTAEAPDYTERRITLVSGEFKLDAILTLPDSIKNPNPPCAILVHGSGPSDKDETIMMRKPFKDLAEGLASHGIATLRYDKRTYAYRKEMNRYEDKATLDFETTDDALAAFRLLNEGNTPIDKDRIFVIGHSLGAMMTPRIMEKESGIRGGIMMSANATRLDSVMLYQINYLDSIQPSMNYDKEKTIKELELIAKIGTPQFDKDTKYIINTPTCYWESVISYNQINTARKIDKPLFIMGCDKDYQVPPSELRKWENALHGKPNISFKEYKGLSHLYMPAGNTPSPADYFGEGHMTEDVIEDIAAFINAN